MYKYKVINQSGVPIKIISYRSDSPEKDPAITNLEVGDTLEKIFEDFLPPRRYGFKEFFGNNQLYDSLNVIYNQEKIALFRAEGCQGSLRNPLNRCEYRDLEETFIFLEQDVLDAQDCNGNCN